MNDSKESFTWSTECPTEAGEYAFTCDENEGVVEVLTLRWEQHKGHVLLVVDSPTLGPTIAKVFHDGLTEPRWHKAEWKQEPELITADKVAADAWALINWPALHAVMSGKFPRMPKAIWSGEFQLGGVKVKCHTLDDGERIVEADSLEQLLGIAPQPEQVEPKPGDDWDGFGKWRAGG